MKISKMRDSKKLSVIIVNYRSQEQLKKCLGSIFEKIFTSVDGEIIVVNNDPEENLDLLEKNDPKITVINQKKNVGFGSAANIGAKKAKGEYFFFLNPDTEILEGRIEDIIDFLSSDSSLGVVGPRILGKNNVTQPWSVGQEIDFLEILLNNLGFIRNKKIWKSSESQEVDWVSGAAFLVPGSLFRSIGGFDRKFFMYFEDVDFCRRVREQNKKILFWPHFSIIHKCGQSLKDDKKRKSYYYFSQDYYFEKHFGVFRAKLIKLLRKIINSN